MTIPHDQPWMDTLRQGEREISVEVGRLGAQADGSVLLRSGREALLVTALSAREAAPAQEFFPLTVEYREKLAGAGRIPGGFFRREGRAGTREILGSRLVDRSIRPLFPEGFRNETQVVATLHSYDEEGDPEVLAITGASMALHCSAIPWEGPVAGVRVARVDGAVRVFPSSAERATAELDLLVAVSRHGLIMVEGHAAEAPEVEVLEALKAAQEAAAGTLDFQDAMRDAIGPAKRPVAPAVVVSGMAERIGDVLIPQVEELYAASGKLARRARMREMIDGAVLAWDAQAVSEPPAASSADASSAPTPASARDVAEQILKHEIRARALAGRRLDGRGPAEIRPISGEVGCLPGAHGSGLFTRGETQALVTCTLGRRQDEQLVEELGGLRRERFMLHYNFPPYSVGEVRPLRGPGRREVGHGNLARRALHAVLPGPDDFPYTVRVEAEITSSNGSSSMATVCGGCLALMDAGVPLRRPVAGIAMGLILEGERRVVLSDILGDEDHLGDMDFKVAGTSEGVTALQLDNKLGSLPPEILAAALEQARAGRLHILAQMAGICPGPREAVPPQAPQVLLRRIRPARVRDLIGPGGRHIQGIQQSTSTEIDVDDMGRVLIYGRSRPSVQEAARLVRHYTGEPHAGRFYRGRVTGVMDFGCFVELFHGIEGLVPRAELDQERGGGDARGPAVGDEMIVKVVGASREGKIQLSCKGAGSVAVAEIED